MIWNTIPNDERLRLWKTLRTDIVELGTIEQLQAVAKFCSQIPYGSRTVDYYSPQEWPTPWEILFYGSFCTSSISLLMYYTLILSEPELNIEMLLVEDDDGVYLLPCIDDQFVLNFELSKVSNYSDIWDEFRVLKKYSREQIRNIT